jgi:hypothetical protein
MRAIKKAMGFVRFKLRYYYWLIFEYPVIRNPLHGNGEVRKYNRKLLTDRWLEKEPKEKDYDL